MNRFLYHYFCGLPGCIWWFATRAPITKLPIIFASIHRMAHNTAVLKQICEMKEGMDRNLAIREAEKFTIQQRENLR